VTTSDTGADTTPRPWTALGPEDGPAIVFVHGTRLTRNQWWPQVRRLSRTYRCVALDLPAHGARSDEPFTLAGAAAAVAEAIDSAVPAGRAVVVGLSLGGYVAIETAERYPGRVTGLVLAGCSAEALGPAAMPFRGLAWILEHAPRRVIDVLNIAFFRLRYRRPVSEPIIAGGFWSAGGAQALRTLLGRRFLERLGRLWTPVLVVNGALDPVFGPGGELWAASCRQGRQVVIPWAGHLSNLDRPGPFSAHVDGFARELARDGARGA
jgi:pimeloyl-ACP methyl ester carboxylesterase